MGCIMPSNTQPCAWWESPVHQVTLTNPFYLGRYEVTQAQWTAKMGSNPAQHQGASLPVDTVNWTSIQGYLGSAGMRLPTEAEWEYACRAGTQTPFYNGSTDESTVGSLAWYSPNSGGQSRPVGGKRANGFGLYDMLGNVWEWVNDWYGDYSSASETNPTGPATGSSHALRGGSFANGGMFIRSSSRVDETSGDTAGARSFGFRVARNP
jgi:formylglycine-generating enzyme required for sulfatase activity